MLGSAFLLTTHVLACVPPSQLTIQGDLSVPRRVLDGVLADEVRVSALREAITQASGEP